jgi:hypothetical protein
LTVPLNDSGGLDQHHRVHTARPQAVEQIQSKRSIVNSRGRPGPLAAKNMQLMAESEVLWFHRRPAAQSAGNNRSDRTHGLIHAVDTTVANLKTLDFSAHSEFLVGTIAESGSR